MLLFLAGCALACSTQKNNLVNREYHTLNTKHNVLFNGNEALDIGQAILYQNNQDNFLEILPIEPITLQGEDEDNQATIPSFSIAEEKAVKAIQKHSMNIGGRQRIAKYKTTTYCWAKPVISTADLSQHWKHLTIYLKAISGKKRFI